MVRMNKNLYFIFCISHSLLNHLLHISLSLKILHISYSLNPVIAYLTLSYQFTWEIKMLNATRLQIWSLTYDTILRECQSKIQLKSLFNVLHISLSLNFCTSHEICNKFPFCISQICQICQNWWYVQKIVRCAKKFQAFRNPS